MYLKPLVASLALALSACATTSGDRQAMGPEERQAWNMAGMRVAHPDLRWRLEALDALEQGRTTLARDYLERAARYGDKPAQALLAEMHWSGRGGAQDRAAGYAWMDLAAERGNPLFAAWRETYWSGLAAAERERALEVGRALYGEFGDPVAQLRLERVLRQTLTKVTGSRTGSTAGVRVHEPPSTKLVGTGGSPGGLNVGRHVPRYYDDRFWKPDQYWDWKEAVLAESTDLLRSGTVTIGEIEQQIAEDQARR